LNIYKNILKDLYFDIFISTLIQFVASKRKQKLYLSINPSIKLFFWSLTMLKSQSAWLTCVTCTLHFFHYTVKNLL